MFPRLVRWTAIVGIRQVHVAALRQKVVKIKDAPSVDDVFRTLISSPVQGAPSLPTLAAAMHRLARYDFDREKVTSEPLFRELIAHLDRLSNMMSASQLTMVARSLGRLHSLSSLWAQLQTQAIHIRRDFNPEHFTTLMCALANVNMVPDPDFLRMIEEEAGKQITSFTNEDASQFLAAFARLKIRPGDQLIDGLFAQYTKYVKEANAESFGAIIWALGEFHFMPEAGSMDVVLEEAFLTHCQDFSVANLSKLFLGLANLGVRPRSSFVRKFMIQATVLVPQFDAARLSQMVWSLAKLRLGVHASALVQELLKKRVDNNFEFGRRDAAVLLCGLAALNMTAETALLDHIAQSTLKYTGKNVECLPDLLYGFVKAKYVPPVQCLRKISNDLLQEAPTFSTRELGLLMYCLGSLGWRNEAFTRHFCKHALEKTELFEPGDIAFFISGLAKGWHHVRPELVQAMERQIIEKAHKFAFGHVSLLFRGFAELNVKASKELIELLLQKVTLEFGKPTPVMLADMMWSLASLGVTPEPALVDLIAEDAATIITQFSPSELSDLTWGFATLGLQPKSKLMDGVQGFALAFLDNFQTQSANQMTWALSTLGVEANSTLLTKLRPKLDAPK